MKSFAFFLSISLLILTASAEDATKLRVGRQVTNVSPPPNPPPANTGPPPDGSEAAAAGESSSGSSGSESSSNNSGRSGGSESTGSGGMDLNRSVGVGPESGPVSPGKLKIGAAIGAAVAVGAAIAAASRNRRRVETGDPHPLKGSINRRMNLFSSLARHGGERPPRRIEGDAQTEMSYVNADQVVV